MFFFTFLFVGDNRVYRHLHRCSTCYSAFAADNRCTVIESNLLHERGLSTNAFNNLFDIIYSFRHPILCIGLFEIDIWVEAIQSEGGTPRQQPLLREGHRMAQGVVHERCRLHNIRLFKVLKHGWLVPITFNDLHLCV